MKKLIMAFIATLCQSLSAQEEPLANKVFYTEMGGAGVIMSANFDSRFKSNERLGFGYRLGAGFGFGDVRTEWVDRKHGLTYIENIKQSYYTFPAGLNYVFGRSGESNTFEVGAGATFLTHKVALYNRGDKKPGNVIGFLTFMYRVMPLNGGFSFRIGFTPIIGTGGDMMMSGAVGFGYAF